MIIILIQLETPMLNAPAYQLTLTTDLSIAITDTRARQLLCRWRGPVVRYLIESRALPGDFHRVGTYACDKCVVWHLILAATAARCVLSKPPHACAEKPNAPRTASAVLPVSYTHLTLPTKA